MKLNQLRDVLAIAELGSLRAAGRFLGVTQPAITRSVRELEQELGAPLFERQPKGVSLTEVGAAFIRRAAAVQAELQRARDEIDQIRGGQTGEITIGLSTASTMVMMPVITGPFRKRYPDAVLKIVESLFPPVEADVMDGKMDLYVGPMEIEAASPQLEVERLFGNQRVVLGRSGHPLAGSSSLADLLDAEWVRPTLSVKSTEGDLHHLFVEAGLPPPKVVLHARSALTTWTAVAQSDLLTILPRQWIEANGPPNIQVICPAMPAPPICMAKRRAMPLTPMAEYLSDLIRRAGGHYRERHGEPS
ncbi:LysR family transcriptional regulator [Sphingomonas sp. CGMCC 1.13654]|uniref:LysR family transcriptional regulator n=1 Tax=Sphingomonas chungangi TaxID=2683589 RepID=A0A838L4Y7_9SPHN|nr:LysR substrate-binding domain-containing protein [Sphingomonas chungangi]MBA2933519.1 LysR family transcriptional regulator [Sphingomonas chungangi]MVW54852.1 LysR family transcriptional regulator [Sphingomonas chungangi]